MDTTLIRFGNVDPALAKRTVGRRPGFGAGTVGLSLGIIGLALFLAFTLILRVGVAHGEVRIAAAATSRPGTFGRAMLTEPWDWQDTSQQAKPCEEA